MKSLLCLCLLVCSLGAVAQEGTVLPGAMPRPDTRTQLTRSASANEHFIYQYITQEIPIIDDFSVDRMRHLNSTADDPDVTLQETFYALTVAGASTPGMAFNSDTTWHYTVDATDPENIIVERTANPSQWAEVRVVTVYPVVGPEIVEVWPPHTIRDTVGDPSTDVVPLTPDLVQDSMLVYLVAADTRTYTNPDNATRPLVLWADDDAYINGGFPVDPPTVGVATLDALDRTGYPYMPDAPNTQGIADRLTSVPINLFYPAGDSIYFSFFYQSLGLSGDGAEGLLDSLRLEFFMPDEPVGSQWQLVWSRKHEAVQPFQQVLLPIVDWRLLRNGFRFRFSAKATMGGAVDQWHIDYVRLGRNRAYDDTRIDDVAFLYPEQSLLLRYTSVPHVKFAANPAGYMAPSINARQRNLSTTDRFITWGYRSGPESGPLADFSGGNNISNNASTIFNSTFTVNSAPNNYLYNVSGGTDVSYLRTKLWTQATPDACRYNDTISFVQELSNYYSYDDGTAEAGYFVAGADGPKRMAMRFNSAGGDSLRAVRLYFTPIFSYDLPNDPRDGNFLITVWSSLQPEQTIFQNLSFSTPEYRTWGPNYFVEYPLDSTIWVEGTFYVGLVQTNNQNIFLGMDKNRVNNDLMFYNAGPGWTGSGIQGTLMIRPVVVAEEDPFASVPSVDGPARMNVFPNPAQDQFSLTGEGVGPGSRIELLDATGRTVRQWRHAGTPFQLDDVAPGPYVLRASDDSGRVRATGRLMVQ